MESSELYVKTQSKAADKKQRRPDRCRNEEQEVKCLSSVSPVAALSSTRAGDVRISIKKLRYPCRSAQDYSPSHTIEMAGFMELDSDIKAS